MISQLQSIRIIVTLYLLYNDCMSTRWRKVTFCRKEIDKDSLVINIIVLLRTRERKINLFTLFAFAPASRI